MEINGIEYISIEEANARCKALAKATPGATFSNHAHHKTVRVPKPQAEIDAHIAAHGWANITNDILGFQKLYTDSPILKTHPELKGLWKRVA